MRSSIKCSLFYLILISLLFNIYLISLFTEHERIQYDLISYGKKFQFLHGEKGTNQFLILDWTVRRHIFKEENQIKCKLKFVLKSGYSVHGKDNC